MLETHLEGPQPLVGDDICPHEAPVDLVATPLVVRAHTARPRSLVEALVDVLGREPQLAEALAQRLCGFEHGKCGGGGRLRSTATAMVDWTGSTQLTCAGLDSFLDVSRT